MYDETNPSTPSCHICGNPASQLFDEGIYLCATHTAEARCWVQEATSLEWIVTAEGIAALEASRRASVGAGRRP